MEIPSEELQKTIAFLRGLAQGGEAPLTIMTRNLAHTNANVLQKYIDDAKQTEPRSCHE